MYQDESLTCPVKTALLYRISTTVSSNIFSVLKYISKQLVNKTSSVSFVNRNQLDVQSPTLAFTSSRASSNNALDRSVMTCVADSVGGFS